MTFSLTVTGGMSAVDKHHFEKEDGAIVANSGHLIEINIDSLEKNIEDQRQIREFVEDTQLKMVERFLFWAKVN